MRSAPSLTLSSDLFPYPKLFLSAVFGGGAHAYQVDVSDEQAVIRFAETVAAHHGVPDIVVNNAGIGFSGTFTATDQLQFERVLDINFWGVVYGRSEEHTNELPLLMTKPYAGSRLKQK